MLQQSVQKGIKFIEGSLTLLEKQGGTLIANNEVMPVRIGGKLLPLEPLVSIRKAKKIVETEVPGRNGTVKEMMGYMDAEITIAGTLQGANKDQLNDQIQLIIDLFSKEYALSIECERTEQFGIEKVVLADYTLPMLKGNPAREEYSLRLQEDKELSLEEEIIQLELDEIEESKKEDH